MRFLLYFPLPLLLILCSSFVVTNSPPINSIGDPTYTNDAFVNSSLVMNNYDAIVEKYRRKQGTRVIKPWSLESEGASEPNITENYNNLSIDELKTKLESEEGNVAKLIKNITDANEELKKEEEEAKVPLQEYEDAKKDWERLDGIYQEKKKPYTELGYKLGNATKNWNDAKTEFERLENMIREQEKLDADIEKNKEFKKNVENADSLLAAAKARQSTIDADISNQQTIVDGHDAPIGTANTNFVLAEKGFKGIQALYDKCKTEPKSGCPSDDVLKNAKTNFKNAKNALDQAKEQKRLAEVTLNALKKEKADLPDKIKLYEKYIKKKQSLLDDAQEEETDLKEKKNREEQPLEQTRQKNETAAETFAAATKTKNTAKSNLDAFNKDELNKAETDTMAAFGLFHQRERFRDKLHSELGSMKEHLQQLTKDLEQSNIRVEALKKLYEKKKADAAAAAAKQDPSTGSASKIAGALIGLMAIFAITFFVIMVIMNRRNGRKPFALVFPFRKAGKRAGKGPNSNPPNPSVKLPSDPSVAPQQASSSKSNQGAPATAPSNSETPPPPAANSAEAPPPAATAVPNDRNMQKLMPYLKNLDEDARMTFSKFLTLTEATETEKEMLKKFVDPNSIVRTFEKKFFIFNTEEPSGEIWVYWRGHVLRRVDARRIPLIPLDLEAPYDTPIKMCENPSKDRSQMYWDHASDNFFLVANFGRKSLKQMLIDKALTSESMDKWKQTLLKMKNRMQAGRAEAEGFFANIWCKISQFTRKIMAWTQSEEPVDPVWLENELDQLSEFELILMYATINGDKKAAGEVSMIMHELKRVAKECRETRKAPCKTRIRSLHAQMQIVDKFLGAGGEFLKTVHLQEPNIFFEDDSEEQVGLSQEGESTERSEAGSEAEDEKGSDRSSSNKDKRSPEIEAIEKQKRKEDRAGTAKFLHGERVITEDGADLPDLIHLLHYDKDGNPRKKFTTERCKAEMKRIESNAKSHDLTPQNFDDNAELLKTFLEAIAKDPKYIIKNDEMVSVTISDLHGDVDSLLSALKIGGFFTAEWKKRKYIFTGDYVDRGKKSIDLIKYVFCLRILYPDNIIILRGNHECYETNIHYGFYLECQDRFKDVNNERCGKDMHLLYNYVFSHMSIACLHNGVFHAHGGMSEYFPKNLEDMNDIMPNFMWEPLRACKLAGQLIWSDPCFGISGWEGGSRGSVYGEDVVYEFKKRHPEVVMIVRAHQVMNNGEELFAGGLLVSLFSTTRYTMPPGYPNRAAVMIATPDRVASLQHFVGVGSDVFDRFVKGLEPELRTKLIYDHNLENLFPSLKTKDFKPAEPDCKSETIRMC